MTYIAAIACLGVVSLVAYALARHRSSIRLGPLSRRQVAARLIVLVVVVAIGWLLFPIVWLLLVGPSCCNP